MFLNTYSEYMEAYSDEDIRALDGGNKAMQRVEK